MPPWVACWVTWDICSGKVLGRQRGPGSSASFPCKGLSQRWEQGSGQQWNAHACPALWPLVLTLACYLLSRFSHGRCCVTTVDCSPPGSSVHGILQARIVEWMAISSSRRSDPGIKPASLPWGLLHWQAGSLPLVLPVLTLQRHK